MLGWALLACGIDDVPELATSPSEPLVVSWVTNLAGPQGPTATLGDSTSVPTRPAPPPVEEEAPTDAEPVEPEPAPAPGPLVARVTADVDAGAFPLVVSFDASGSELGSGDVTYAWSFGDGTTAEAGDAVHTYVGAGVFAASLTITDEATGEASVAQIEIDVTTPGCPVADASVSLGTVQDGSLTEISGIVPSRLADDAWWVHEDSGQQDVLTAVDGAGATLAVYELPELSDFEDLASAVDPETGVPTLFLGDIGDNGYERGDVSVLVAAEPDPLTDGALATFEMVLEYPDGPQNAETLLVDPVTFDLYVVTKVSSGPAKVYVKRAPHAAGDFVVEDLGGRDTLELTATGGDVSADGAWVVVRDYTDVARLFVRDGYRPLEDAFDAEPCEIPIHGEFQGEAIAFTPDGAGVVTVSEGEGPDLWYVGGL